MKKLIYLTIIALCSSLHASEGSLEGVLNAFLSTYAKTNLLWKKNIVLTQEPENVPPGFQLGLSKKVGYYFFVPKTWDDLTDAERNDVMNDPRLTAFIVSLRQATQSAPGDDGKVPLGANGKPMFPVDGVSLADVAKGSKEVAPKKRVIDIRLSAEQLTGAKSVKIQALQ
jgi:hypothetical protein